MGNESSDGRITASTKVTIGFAVAIIGAIVTPIGIQASLSARVAGLELVMDRHAKKGAHEDAARRLERIEVEIRHIREDAKRENGSDVKGRLESLERLEQSLRETVRSLKNR